MKTPSIGDVRATFPERSRLRSSVNGFGLFLLTFSFYLLFCWYGLQSVHWPVKFVFGLLIGLSYSILFVIGHDACHDSLTPFGWLNAAVARVCFLPSLHPYTTWELGHNQLHHSWTNLKGMDYVYPPFSKAEFDALPLWRRLAERFYRTVFGCGFFYMIDIWWNHLILPRPAEWKKLSKRVYFLDLGLVTAFCIAEFALVLWLDRAASPLHRAGDVVCLLIVPFLFWNWISAYVTVQHHTHPNVAWFKSREQWNYFNGQVLGTVHVKLPRPVEILFHNILEHTAHHADPKIPLYNLPECQRNLEEKFTGDVTLQDGGVFNFWTNLNVCQLYDYENHRWLKFDGTPTTKPLFPRGEAGN
jgi:omega-6 fatty acid desaturase (delta-12 desaturase)